MTLPFELNLGLVFGALVVVVMALVIVLTIQNTRKYTQQRLTEALELGFCPTDQKDYSYLLKKIASINPRYGKSGMQLRHVFQRQLPEGRLYYFDLWDTSGEDNTELLSHTFLLIGQGVDMPEFVISTLPDTSQMPVMVAGWMKKFNQWMLTKSLQPVELPREYGVGERLQIVSDDPPRMLTLVDAAMLARLAGQPSVMLAGKGDAIMVSPTTIPGVAPRNESPSPASRYNMALDAIRSMLSQLPMR